MNKPKFTKGKWTYFPFADGYIKSQDNVYSTNICKILEVDSSNEITNRKSGNAELIAAAGTAATKLHDMGIDPTKAFEALPEILYAMQKAKDGWSSMDLGNIIDFLNRIKLESK